MTNQKHLVVGVGQIGTAIRDILDTDYLDITPEKSKFTEEKYEALHICIPHSPDFEEKVLEYQKRFSPEISIIHATVPVGTSEKVSAVHSPCRGIHPHLEKGIRTFVKYFGGKDADRAAKYFSDIGIETKTTPSSKNTEAMKLWDTTIYAWNIALEKMIFSYCTKNDLDFNIVYTEANKSYNEGYAKLGRPEYAKYVLKHVEGKIGGHCVPDNLELLDSEISDYLKKFNASL